ncbi:MAG: hypothetical protein ACI8Q1_003376 [Parvicella sp.]|jgi:hypothetical protein
MKNLLIGICIAFLSFLGCKDNDEPKPENSIKIEDLLGTWVSVDSAIVNNEEGDFIYVRDTFSFSLDTFTNMRGELGSPVLYRSGYRFAHYIFSTENIDTLVLDYFGPNKESYRSEHKIVIDDNILSLNNNMEFYPQSHFDKFRKKQ